MITYIFHNETRNQIATKKLFINHDEIMNSLFSGAYFRAVIKCNDWDKKDVVCAISDNEEMLTIVYEDDEVVFCDNSIHVDNAFITLTNNVKEDICDCGTSSEVDNDDYDYTELDSDYSDYDSDNASEYSDDIEEDVWALRRKMVGLKNITKEKMQDIRNSYLKLSSKKDNIHLRVELGMDILKYLWKLVIREFITKEHFDELCSEIFAFIEKKLKYIDSYMRVEYDNFREDILRVSSVEIKN